MDVIPFVHEGLGNSSYLVGLEGGTAMLVDPDRTVDRYLQAAHARGWRVESVLETHLHADFVSGARETCSATGATAFVPEGAAARFAHRALRAGDRVPVPGGQIEAIQSPGHTPEHLSYVLHSERHPLALFSGGALIVGGAARTDLISADLTEQLTRAQYRTLREAFHALPDETLLYPTHGGGSFCSTGAGRERVSTLGRERASNPLLTYGDGEERFVRWFPSTFPAVPAYFAHMRAINQAGPRLRKQIADPPPLSPADFQEASRGALVVDVRPAAEYAAAHVPGSLSNAFRESYATWLGWLVPLETPLLFVFHSVGRGPSPDLMTAVIEESLLVGHERFAAWLDGGIQAWQAAGLPLQSTQLVHAADARRMLLDGAALIDVREPDEFASGHIEGAIPAPLGSLSQGLERVPRDRPVIAQCGHGERSSTAVSLLERAGFGPLLNLNGGIEAWRRARYRVVRGAP